MEDMQALAEEQRKAGMLLDDGAPVKLNMSIAPVPVKAEAAPKDAKAAVFGQEEEEEEDIKKRKVPLVKLDFSAAEGDKAKERLQTIKESVPHDKETLFKAKVRWDGLNDVSLFFRLVNCIIPFGRAWLTESSNHWSNASWSDTLASWKTTTSSCSFSNISRTIKVLRSLSKAWNLYELNIH